MLQLTKLDVEHLDIQEPLSILINTQMSFTASFTRMIVGYTTTCTISNPHSKGAKNAKFQI